MDYHGFSLSTALTANSFQSFCVLRVLTGLGLGVLLPLSTTYINELAPRRAANRFALWGVALGWALGGAAAGLVGVFITPRTGWRGLYFIGSLSVLLIPFVHLYLPESPKFSLLRGKTDALRNFLSELRPERVGLYRDAEISVPRTPTRAPLSALLNDQYRRLSFSIWVTSFLSLFCIFGLSAWIPTLMLNRGESFASSFGFGALMQIMSFVGGLVCGHIVDKRGASRTWLCLWWLAGAAAILSLVFFHDHLTNVVCTAMAGFCIIGAQFVLNNFTAASYDTSLRATAVGMELGVGRLGAILGPFIGGALQQHFGGQNAMLVAMCIAAAAAAISILFAVSRAKDRSTASDVASADASARTV